MRNEIEAICEELSSWQQKGVSRIYVEDQTLSQLENVVRKLNPTPSTSIIQSVQIQSQRQEEVSSHPRTSPNKPATPTPYHSKRTPTLITLPTEAAVTEPAKENLKKIKENKTDASIPTPSVFELPSGDKQTQWNWLKEKVLSCPVCNNHVKPGKKVVFGVGNINADIFFCGEAPGADEEIEGEPFVGKAGQLLTKIIQAMGLQRSDVYIGNIMNWRPETGTEFGNRPPTEQEMAFCLPYLKAQLAIIKPKVIVALGNTAVTGLLGPDPKRRMTDLRGNWSEFEGIPLMITYHPSYLLRNNIMRTKRQVWEDMLMVMERVGMKISDKQRAFFSE